MNKVIAISLNGMRIDFINIALLLVLVLTVALPVAAEDTDTQEQSPQTQVIDGELLLPEDYDRGAEKKCVTVCKEWGENCIINPATGSRKCRRVCQSFTEECY